MHDCVCCIKRSLTFGTVGGEVGNLRLKSTHQVCRGIHNGSTKIINFARITLHGGRKAVGWVQAHTQHRLVLRLLRAACQ